MDSETVAVVFVEKGCVVYVQCSGSDVHFYGHYVLFQASPFRNLLIAPGCSLLFPQ